MISNLWFEKLSLFRVQAFLLAACLLLLSGLLSPVAVSARPENQESAPRLLFLTTSGPLTPAMAEYLSRGLRSAEGQGAEAIILQLNTPGGSIDLMNRMVTDIRASRVPVVVWVAPQGAMAGSAGTLITLAGHVAAMAPETIIGAASPIGGGGEDLGETAAVKEKNALKKTARSLTERRGAEAVALAESTIETAEAATATEALRAGMIDFLAADQNELLRKLDGFSVQVQGDERVIHTAFAVVETFNPSLIEQILGALTNPNLVLVLMNVGVAALLIELSSPGGWVAGFIGAVLLALSAYGLGVLPVNWFGAVFLVIAFALFLLDLKAPTHGALTVAGVASLLVGGLVLFNSPNVPPFQRVSVPLAIGSSILTGAMFFIILIFALRAQSVPVRTGQESMVGRVGVARSDLSPRGIVQLGGEQWTAELAGESNSLPKGSRVLVVKVEGVRLLVRPAVDS